MKINYHISGQTSDSIRYKNYSTTGLANYVSISTPAKNALIETLPIKKRSESDKNVVNKKAR